MEHNDSVRLVGGHAVALTRDGFGRPVVRVTNLQRGFWILLPLGECVDIANAINDAVTRFVDEEAAKPAPGVKR